MWDFHGWLRQDKNLWQTWLIANKSEISQPAALRSSKVDVRRACIAIMEMIREVESFETPFVNASNSHRLLFLTCVTMELAYGLSAIVRWKTKRCLVSLQELRNKQKGVISRKDGKRKTDDLADDESLSLNDINLFRQTVPKHHAPFDVDTFCESMDLSAISRGLKNTIDIEEDDFLFLEDVPLDEDQDQHRSPKDQITLSEPEITRQRSLDDLKRGSFGDTTAPDNLAASRIGEDGEQPSLIPIPEEVSVDLEKQLQVPRDLFDEMEEWLVLPRDLTEELEERLEVPREPQQLSEEPEAQLEVPREPQHLPEEPEQQLEVPREPQLLPEEPEQQLEVPREPQQLPEEPQAQPEVPRSSQEVPEIPPHVPEVQQPVEEEPVPRRRRYRRRWFVIDEVLELDSNEIRRRMNAVEPPRPNLIEQFADFIDDTSALSLFGRPGRRELRTNRIFNNRWLVQCQRSFVPADDFEEMSPIEDERAFDSGTTAEFPFATPVNKEPIIQTHDSSISMMREPTELTTPFEDVTFHPEPLILIDTPIKEPTVPERDVLDVSLTAPPILPAAEPTEPTAELPSEMPPEEPAVQPTSPPLFPAAEPTEAAPELLVDMPPEEPAVQPISPPLLPAAKPTEAADEIQVLKDTNLPTEMPEVPVVQPIPPESRSPPSITAPSDVEWPIVIDLVRYKVFSEFDMAKRILQCQQNLYRGEKLTYKMLVPDEGRSNKLGAALVLQYILQFHKRRIIDIHQKEEFGTIVIRIQNMQNVYSLVRERESTVMSETSIISTPSSHNTSSDLTSI